MSWNEESSSSHQTIKHELAGHQASDIKRQIDSLAEINMNIQGGCLCGAVRYQCSGNPLWQFNCHCRDCQKTTGSAFAPIAFFPSASVSIAGDIRYFQSMGGSGKSIRRGFCPTCGSQLFSLPDIVPTMISIRAGTLDDPAIFRPKAHLYASHAAPWDYLDPALTTFAENPTE